MYLSGVYGKFHAFKLTLPIAARRKDAALLVVGWHLQAPSGAGFEGMGQ
jgi:hypothetical protein